MNTYSDPTTGEWVGEYETRNSDGEVNRQTEWFENKADAEHFSRTGENRAMADLASAVEANSKASQHNVEVITQASGQRYRAKVSDGNGRTIGPYTLALTDEGMVWIYTADYSVGLYNLDRFNGALTPNNIRQFFQEAFQS